MKSLQDEKDARRRNIVKWSLTAAIMATAATTLGLIIIMHFSL
jgi:hypothetical protein